MLPSALVKSLPVHKSPYFRMKVFPKAALARPKFPWPSPPRKLVPHAWKDERRVNVSLNMITTVKPFNSQVVRRRVRNKVRAAVHLLLTRNPSFSLDGEGNRVVEWGNTACQDMVLQGVFRSLLRCPYMRVHARCYQTGHT